MKKDLLIIALGIAFVACSNDVFDSDTMESEAKAKYARNFVAKYGEIRKDQSWDLTSGGQLVTRAGAKEITVQPVSGLNFGKPVVKIVGSGGNAKYTIEGITMNKPLYDAVDKTLPEGTPHAGKPAVLAAPDCTFTIYPVCARGSLKYDLCMKVDNGAPVKIFSKTWTDDHVPYYNGMTTVDQQLVSMPGVKVTAPLGTSIELYMNIHDNHTTVSTSSGHTYYVKAPNRVIPQNVTVMQNAGVNFLGFEDNLNLGDHDFNDLVVCVVGNPYLPVAEPLNDKTYTVESYTEKRYMIEDLGATDDFDFNDIVMDVSDHTTVTHQVEMINNLIGTDSITNTESKQKAILRHLGGTLPFQLTIGETAFQEMAGMMEVSPNTEFDIKGWIPADNNISVKVKEESGAVFTLTFPKAGTAPMIIAVDPTQEWMKERESIPSSWWTNW